MQLTFEVSNQHITRIDSNRVVAGSKSYLTALFDFKTDEWSDLTKTAIFAKGGDVYNVILDDTGACDVPWEIIRYGQIEVSVFAGNLITVDTTLVDVNKSGYQEGETPSDPTPDVYQQIISMIEDLQSGAVDPDMMAKAIEDYMTAHPIETLTTEDVQDIVSDYVTAHKAELKGDTGYTPVKGVDYWTDEDIATIDSHINAQIGGVLNGSY